MEDHVPASRNTRPGLSASQRAWVKLLGTSLLAGITGGMVAAIPAHALGLSVAIASSVSGTLAAAVVAIVIVRHGPAP